MFTVTFSPSSPKTTSGSPPPRRPRLAAVRRRAPRSATRASPGTGPRSPGPAGGTASPEVYAADTEGGEAARLTYWGDSRTRVTGWTTAGEVLAVTAAGQPDRPVHLGPRRSRWTARRPGGCPSARSATWPWNQPGTALLTGRTARRAAFWKRYRGGTAGRLWIATADDPLFTRILADLDGQLASPMLIGGRLFFLSDHEGTGNIYSCALDGTGLRRHTDHDGMYARNPSTDGQPDRLPRGRATSGCWTAPTPPRRTRSTSPSAPRPRPARRG